ncbi:MAG: hypothetical protein A3F68_04985 [Acidobacteria bacterium RIFCSPLOWO2_12_FULL_54_10]|nr:MAG: hypothetical protein A3F68_04985 [Acidobacteria bacterium RIFCSPLOWO2_12_FULL_54_10]
MRWFLFRVFAKRVCFLYGAVSMLTVAILASLYMTSGYAIEGYITDQLERMPWDIAVLQRGDTSRFVEMRDQIAELEDIERIESFGLLRVEIGPLVQLEIDQAGFPVKWIGFVGTSQPDILPPELRRTLGNNSNEAAPPSYQAALVSAQRGGREEASAATRRFTTGSTVRLALVDEEPHEEEELHADADEHQEEWTVHPGEGESLFQAQVTMPPAELERQEFNKWMLRNIGSVSYLPDDALIITVPMDVFTKLASQFAILFETAQGSRGDSLNPYIPEITHLIALDRSQWVSPWDLEASLAKVEPFVTKVHDTAQWMTPFSYVSSELQSVLALMTKTQRLVQLVTLLVALPLLWLGWVLARNMSSLLVLNERRKIGLALIRGIPVTILSSTLLFALLAGGILGGFVGLAGGTAIPVLFYNLSGHTTPSAGFFLRGFAFAIGFVVLGGVFALLSGFGILRYVRKLTPREAMARVSEADSEAHASRVTFSYITVSLIALALGGYKIASWIAGVPLAAGLLQNIESLARIYPISENILNFAGVPLFLFGLTGLLRWRVKWIQSGLSIATAPIVGRMHWFAGQHLALRSGRVVTVLFVAALAMSLTLLPQVAADSFYGRVLRGVQTSVGGDLHIEFNMTEIGDGESRTKPLSEYENELTSSMLAIQEGLQKDSRISSVTTIQQFIVPGFYIPGQSGLMLNLVDVPQKYIDTVYYEDSLGISRPFHEIVNALPEDGVTASQGLLRMREIPLDRDVTLGYGGDSPVPVRFRDITSFLPGQPSAGVAERVGFGAAEVDYLNHMLRADARMIAGGNFAKSGLAGLSVLPSKAVFIVRTKSGDVDDQTAMNIAESLPIRPQEVRWKNAESKRVSKDMFISLALENMKVFMIGGLLLALASVSAIGVANYLADRRTFGLLRLRGLPIPMLLRLSVSMFLTPVLGGLVIGVLLGIISGYGLSQVVWELPRVLGVAGFLSNRLVLTFAAATSVIVFTLVLTAIAVAFGLWPARKSPREAITER